MGSLPFQLGVKFAQLQKRKKSLDQDQRRSCITQGQHLLPYATRGQEFPGQVAIKGAMRSQILKVEEVRTPTLRPAY